MRLEMPETAEMSIEDSHNGSMWFLVQLQLVVVILVTIVPPSKAFATTMQDNADQPELDENSVNLKPWLERWEAKRIGFHLPEANPVLIQYAPQLFPIQENEDCSAARVFVPLCGKTLDMAYLTSMAGDVVGVEGIKRALEEFAQEQPDLQIENKGIDNGFERFVGKKITLLKGDFFELTTEDTGGSFDVIYDRASMVAIDPKLRSSYVNVLSRLLSKGGKILLVVLERQGTEEAVKKGPPFSIPESTVKEFYEGLDWVEAITRLQQKDTLTEEQKAQDSYQGLDQLLETVYMIQGKT